MLVKAAKPAIQFAIQFPFQPLPGPWVHYMQGAASPAETDEPLLLLTKPKIWVYILMYPHTSEQQIPGPLRKPKKNITTKHPNLSMDKSMFTL